MSEKKRFAISIYPIPFGNTNENNFKKHPQEMI